jgi:hypothetical protein
MARRLSVVRCCVLCCLLFGSGKNTRGQTADTWKDIPSPPQQTAAWKAPATKLSPQFVSATAKLFEQGLADPRGCPYREITVVVGSFEPPWSGTVVKTHGWVIPDVGKQTLHFAVC